MPQLLEIPITDEDASFKIRTELDGVQYIFRFDWNGRGRRWQLSIFDAEEQPIVMGLPLNINTDLIGRFRDPRLPTGPLFLFDTTLRNQEAGREDLGRRAILIYESP